MTDIIRIDQLPERTHPFALVLSGGGVKGVAHVALLKQLKEVNMTPSVISGSSSGALVAALYASGMEPAEMVEFFRSTPLFKMTWISTDKPGIFNTEKYLSIIQKYLPSRFEDLEIPLIIAATNLEKSRIEYFGKGDLYRPLLASCAVPFLFSPVSIGENWYADGGIMDNFPIGPVQHLPIAIAGSYACRPGEREKTDLNSAIKLSNHANVLLLHAANAHKMEVMDWFIDFDLESFGSFNTKYIDEIYAQANQQLQNHLHTTRLPQFLKDKLS